MSSDLRQGPGRRAPLPAEVLPCRMLITGPGDGTPTARTADELRAIAAGHQGATVAVGAPAAATDAFLAGLLDSGPGPLPGLAVRAGALTVADVGPDGRGVIRSLNGDAALSDLVTAAGVDPAVCRVVVARHGQSMAVEDGAPVYSHHPIGLTVLGRRQAGRLAAALAPVRLDAVYTSDLNRAQETAGPLAAGRGLTPVVVPGLREIFLGDFEGQTLARVQADHDRFVPWLEVTFNDRFPTGQFHHPSDLVFPGGESVAAVWSRVRDPFLEIAARHLGGTIAVVAHGWVLQPLLCHVIGVPIDRYFRLQLPYAAPTVIDIDAGGRGSIVMLNGIDPEEGSS